MARKPNVSIVLILITLLLLLSACSSEQPQNPSDTAPQFEAPDMRVGFLVSSEAADRSDPGRQRVIELLGEDHVFTQAADADAVEMSVKKLVEQECRIIFSTREDNQHAIASVAPQYPDVHFVQLRGESTNEQLWSYNARLYQGWYLCGIAAGGATQSQTIGYVAPEANSEVIRGVNGFALGVKQINPEAEVHVAWSSGYNMVGDAVAAAQELIDKGCDIIVCHEPLQEVMTLIRSNNRYVVTAPNNMSQREQDTFVATPIYDYATYYESVIRAVSEGKVIPEKFWGGIGESTVKMPIMGATVSVEGQTKVQEQYEAMVHGTTDVFEGPIYNQYKLITVPEDTILEGEDLEYMLWFVDNVVGEIPQG